MLPTLLAALLLSLSVDDNAPPPDPHLWLEGIDDAAALDWVRAQNDASADRLKKYADFDELYQQALTALNAPSRIPSIALHGDMLYNLWQDADHPRGVYRRTTPASFATEAPEWEVVLDIDALSASTEQGYTFGGMNCLPPEHKKCLVYLSPGGGDAVEIREFDAEEKVFVESGFQLPAAKQQVTWIDENALYVASDFGIGAVTDSGYPRIIKQWQRGVPIDQAGIVYAGKTSSVSVGIGRYRDKDGAIDVLTEAESFWESVRYQLVDGEIHALDLPRTATIHGVWNRRLLVSLKSPWQHRSERYPTGAVLLADPIALRSDEGNIDLLLDPGRAFVVSQIATTNAAILIAGLENVVGRLYRFTQQDGSWVRQTVAFPDNGIVELSAVNDENGDFYAQFESFLDAPALYHVAGPQWQPTRVKQQKPAFDSSQLVSEQLWTTSADGTRVPYFIVRNRNMKYDGSNPTHIFSYGGFRVSLTPSYSGSYEAMQGAYGKLWLERGGVFVLANIRGGGEFGPDWHSAALLENRHKAFEDFEAVAEDLIARKITSPAHLGIEGRSNGGLLVAATMVRRPDLYGAVICGVPLTDMQRYNKLLAGASWMAEYGDPDDPEQWAFIKTYSPYQTLDADVSYPPILFYTSTRDDRVHPGHARKMAAKMLQHGSVVNYYENLEGGHGGSSTNEQTAWRLALTYAHLWQHLSE